MEKTTHFTVGVLESPVFRNASSAQRRALQDRICYVVELSEKLEHWNENARERQFFDEVELDAWVNIGAPDSDDEISSWLIHTSWSAECEEFNPLSLLSAPLAARLDSISCDSLEGLIIWMSEQGKYLRMAADGVMKAGDICSLAANVMAQNALLLNLLVSLTRARLCSLI